MPKTCYIMVKYKSTQLFSFKLLQNFQGV